MNKTSHIRLPFTNAKIKTLTSNVVGRGIGTVLLDNGIGGQSSYYSIEDYMDTTGRDIYSGRVKRQPVKQIGGVGLSDKISQKLAALNIEKPKKGLKKKNIVIDF